MQIQTEHFGEVTLVNFIDASIEDLLFVLKIRNHPDVRKWMYTKDEIQQDSHLKFIQNLSDDKLNKYILVKQSGKLIGVIYFNQIDFEKQMAWFGLYANLIEPLNGVGSLLQELSLFYAQKILELKVLNLEVISENCRAINLYKKYGFIETGYLQKNGFEVLSMTKEL